MSAMTIKNPASSESIGAMAVPDPATYAPVLDALGLQKFSSCEA